MSPETEAKLRRRAIEAVTDDASALGEAERSSPVSRYLDPERFELERDRVLAGVPRPLALSSELRAAGDFLTVELGGRPVLATRGQDGVARAFLNVCRHRGTRLVDAERGCQKRFACPYHAWTYGLDGALVGVPARERGFPTLERASHGLVGLPLVERHGLLWVGPRPEVELDVAAHLAGLDDDLAHVGLEGLEPLEPFRRTYAANWKLLVEGGLEAYHFPIAHRKTIASLFEGSSFVTDRFGPHSRLVLPKRTLRDAPADQPLRAHANILYSFFPASALIVQADHVARIEFRPRAFDRTDVEITLLVPRGPRSEKAERYWAKNRELTTVTLDEDFALGESIQGALASGANATLTFGRFEHLLGSFHDALEERLA